MTKRDRRDITIKANNALNALRDLDEIIVALAPTRHERPLIYHALRAVSHGIEQPLLELRAMAREEEP